MARPGFSPSFMVLAAITLVLGLNYVAICAHAAGGACGGDMQGLITQCAVYVQKGTPVANPSPTCCAAVKTADIPCICQKITKDIEIMVDMNKVFRLASFCGRPLARGTKCGSK